MDWRVGPQQCAFGTSGSGTATPVLVSPPGCIQGEVAFCEFDIALGRSVDVPHGENWLQLWNWRDAPSTDDIYWSGNATRSGTTTLILNPVTGEITNPETPVAFTIFGTPTVPEASSIMLLGSGVLGLAGMRRKLLR